MSDKRICLKVSHLKVMTAKHLLEEAGIESYVIDKSDSAFAGVLGEIELHIDSKDEERATELLEAAEIL